MMSRCRNRRPIESKLRTFLGELIYKRYKKRFFSVYRTNWYIYEEIYAGVYSNHVYILKDRIDLKSRLKQVINALDLDSGEKTQLPLINAPQFLFNRQTKGRMIEF